MTESLISAKADVGLEHKLPNFLLVGFPKCGTSSLYFMLQRHADIFLPNKKELHFFNVVGKSEDVLKKELFPYESAIKEYLTRSIDEYKKHFLAVTDEKVIGDMTPSYVLDPEYTIKNIYKFLPNPKAVKILMLIRNPIDAACSHYMMQYRRNLEYLSFEDSVAQSELRKTYGHYRRNHIHTFQYYEGVKAFVEKFNDVLVLKQEELYSKPLHYIRKIYSFLEVDDSVGLEIVEHYNKGEYNFTIEDKLKKHLYFKYFENDIDRLESLLDLSLTDWKYTA